MHAAHESPAGDPRTQVVYSGFGLAPRAGDVTEPIDPVAVRRDRAALNEQTRALQRRDDFGREHDTFALDTLA